MAYVVPADLEDLRALVEWAYCEGTPLVPRGAGTGMPGGNVGPHLIVEVEAGLGTLEWVDRESGLLRLGAGVVAAEAERFARDAGFFLPFLPSSKRWCQIGGMVANNAAGARTFRHGATAASVECLEGIFSWGEPFRVGTGLPVPDAFLRLPSRLEAGLGVRVGERDLARAPETRRRWTSGLRPSLPGWPRVRKNASGYALDRYLPTRNPAQLLVGSEGTLAVLTHAELRLVPMAPTRGLGVLAAHSSAELTALALGGEDIGAETCEFLGRRFLEIAGIGGDPQVGSLASGAHGLVLMEVAGERDEVESGLAAILELGQRTGAESLLATDPETMERLWELRHAASPRIAHEAGGGRVSLQFIEDSVVPPEQLGAYLDGLDQILEEAGFDAITFGHAGDGNVHVNPLVDVSDPAWKDRVRSVLNSVAGLVASLGGTLSGEHGDGRLRAPLLDRIWAPPLVAAFRLVKEALDPRGILNPGVILPLPGQDPLEGLEPKTPRGLHGRPEDDHLVTFESPTS
ncbi:MAG: FAD-binding oxidoreductase [Gemmatimonadetes bacterium]|nr:FAD-binding oxidoreductase [Gemmatimonadota bacterium]